MDMAATVAYCRRLGFEWRRKKAAHARWAEARTFGDLGELTAQFAEGALRYHPNGHSDGPDEETSEIGLSLAAVNRAGCVTLQSQPGCDEVWWRQRAAVEMLVVDPAIRERLRAGCERAGLLYTETRPRRWRRDYGTAETVSEHRVNGVWQPGTGFGATDTRGHISEDLAGSDAAVYAARHAWQVTVIDPEWGRNDRFTAALDEFSGRQVPKEASVVNDSKYSSPRDASNTREAVTRAAKQLDLDTYETASVLNCLAFHGWELRKAAPEGEEAAVLPPSERAKGVEARTHGWDGKPLSDADKRFFALRDSGFTGWIDQDGNKAPCPSCEQQDCDAGLTERCNGTGSPPRTDRPTSTAVQSGGMSRANSGGTMSVDLELPTATATDASTPETLAQALRETADNARRSAVDKDAQAESLRSQAAALEDKPDMSESAQGLLNEAARLAEVAEARRGMAAAYEDKAAQVDAQRAK